jgi:hypothetical protein
VVVARPLPGGRRHTQGTGNGTHPTDDRTMQREVWDPYTERVAAKSEVMPS